jgi:hypothetical protein
MQFSLQDMVRKTLAEAEEREKVAQAAEAAPSEEEKKKKEKGTPAQGDNTSTAPERNEETQSVEKTSSVFVEKLASAVEYLNDEFLKVAVGEPESAPAHTPPAAAPGVGPGEGAGSLETNVAKPTPGTQSEDSGQATAQNQPPTVPGPDKPAPGQMNPATALETTLQTPPGGQEDWTEKDVQKQAQVARIRGILTKKAEDALSPASVQAANKDVPPDASASEEGVPPQPAEVNKQEQMVASNQAAIDATKQQAKAVPKERMGEVLDEPAQKKSTDSVLHENLQATPQAGVKLSSVEKVAAAKVLLRKVAEAGEKPDASPEEKARADKLREVLKAKKEQEKQSSFCKKSQMEADDMPISGGY